MNKKLTSVEKEIYEQGRMDGINSVGNIFMCFCYMFVGIIIGMLIYNLFIK